MPAILQDPIFTASPGIPVNSESDFLFESKELLVGAGWTVTESSDGTTYSSTDDLILSETEAGDPAWYSITDPSGTRSFQVQHVSAGDSFRVKYSPSAGFTGGTPSNSQVSSATDEIVVLGSGTDAAPTGAEWLFTATFSQNIIGGFDKVAPHGFYMVTYRTADIAANLSAVWALDPIQGAPVQDTDPVAVLVDGGSTRTNLMKHDDLDDGPWAFLLGPGTAAELTVTDGASWTHNSAGGTLRKPEGGQTNRAFDPDTVLDCVPMVIGETGPEVKGHSGLFHWNGFADSGDLIHTCTNRGSNRPGAKSWIRIGSCLAQWSSEDFGTDADVYIHDSEPLIVGVPAGLPEDIPGGVGL